MRKTLSLFLVVFIVFSMLVIAAPLVGAATVHTFAAGELGVGITGVLDDSGLLTLSGTGPMIDFADGTSPLHDFNITSVVIESGITSVGTHAFSSCRSITLVSLPASITIISESAFEECNDLIRVILPGNATLATIGAGAFAGTDLRSFTIPASVTNIGFGAFQNAVYLALVNNESKVNQTISTSAFAGAGLLASSKKAYYYAANVNFVTANNAWGNYPLTIVAPTSICRILGDNVIGVMDASGALTVSGTGPMFDFELHASPFYNNADLTSIVINSGVTTVGSETFSTCSGLASVTLPESLTQIGSGAFFGAANASFTTISLPDSLETIGDQAFEGCTALTAVDIPAAVSAIGRRAFAGCYDLDNISFERQTGTCTLGTYIFAGSGSPEFPKYINAYASQSALATLATNEGYTWKTVTVSAYSKSKTYGSSDPALTYDIFDTNYDAGTLTFSGALTRAAGENVGDYNITAGTLTTDLIYNVIVDTSNGSPKLIINHKDVVVTASNKAKTYGDADPTLTYVASIYVAPPNQNKSFGEGEIGPDYQISASLLVGDDAFTGSLEREEGNNIGNYFINQGTLTLGSNYHIYYTRALLTIDATDITVTADNKTKMSGEADPTLTYQITDGSLFYEDVFDGSLAREAGTAIGDYAINQGALGLGENYNLTFIPGILSITPLMGTVSGHVTDEFGKPVVGVTVELHSTVRTTTTDSNGHYSFANVEIGQHTITILGSSFTTVSKPLALSEANANQTVDFELDIPTTGENNWLTIFGLLLLAVAAVLFVARRKLFLAKIDRPEFDN